MYSWFLLHWSTRVLCLYYIITMALKYILKSGMVIYTVLFFMITIVLAVQGLVWFHMNFRIIFFSYYCEEWDGGFDWDCTESENGVW